MCKEHTSFLHQFFSRDFPWFFDKCAIEVGSRRSSSGQPSLHFLLCALLDDVLLSIQLLFKAEILWLYFPEIWNLTGCGNHIQRAWIKGVWFCHIR